MMTTTIQPRIYVACLAAYNHGVLHGEWIDATDDRDEMNEHVSRILAASPIPHAEEFAIHDYEGFHGLRVGEYVPLDHVADIVETFERAESDGHDPAALVAYAADMGENVPDAYGAFTDAFRGEWPSFRDYVLDLGSDIDIFTVGVRNTWGGYESFTVPDDHPLRLYFDWDRYADDLEQDYTVLRSPNGVWVFSAG